ncbi:MAG: Eco57I restriction-modification methylase domain-containing protein [Nostoc sp.]
MAERLLQLDDVRQIDSPQKVASLFQKIGYNASAQQLAIDDLELPVRSAEAIWNAYMIADYQRGSESLQVLLFQLQENEWLSPSIASNRMRSLAQSLCRRPSNFLLLGTLNYDQLMLVNPRKSFDADLNLKVSIRKLLIDRANPTNYDRDRLDAIAARNLSPQELYKVQCEAFDVEKLTKEFYRGYREIFEELQRVIKANNQHSYFDDTNRLHQFSQRLLGRIMFLYFLQKKEFLAGDRNFLKTQYIKLRSELDDTDFYNQVLEPLFFELLNKQRPNMESPWGKIPYLNGGLFDLDYGIGVIDAAGVETPPQIELPNSVFDPSGDKGILRFFNSYNFTVSENVQGDEDAAVDPEMLGKVFENMLASEERGQSGTFYTPRGIVQFMCVESLSRYLALQSGMDLEAVRKLIEFETELPDSDINQLLTKEQAKKLKLALNSVRICDPAVGSGAFPMGMMQVILSVKQAIARREGMTVERGSLTISQWKRDIIANNLYGVDIKPEAIEIAKLRMWLSLVVDIPSLEDVEPLPNLDYKLMCGDSLISTIHGEQLIPDPTKDQQTMLNVTPVQSAIQPLIDLQHEYFEAHSQERKILRGKILEAEKNVFRVAIADRLQYWQIEQRNLEQDIRRLKGKASRAQTQKQQAIAAKLQELDSIAAEVERGMRSLNFFQWHLHFNEVFQQQGGFDIVIGNPPYGKLNTKNKEYFNQYRHQDYQKDMYLLFLERCLDFLNESNSIFSMIVPNTWLSSITYKKIRKYLRTNYTWLKFLHISTSTKAFHAVVDTHVFIFMRNMSIDKKHQQSFIQIDVLEDAGIFNSHNLPNEIIPFDGEPINIVSNEVIQKVYRKIISTSLPLSNCCNVFNGVKPFEKGKGKPPQTDKIMLEKPYVIEGDRPNSEWKPLLRGSLIQKYQVLWDNNYWILYGEWLAAPRDSAIFEAEKKIYVRQTGDSIIATLVSSKFIARDNLHIILPKDKNYNSLYFILGIINSQIIDFVYKQINPEKGEALAQVKKNHVEKLPVPTASESDRLAIEALVQKCLDHKGQGVEEWKAEIDDRVAHLYGLTAEEMKIIREG